MKKTLPVIITLFCLCSSLYAQERVNINIGNSPVIGTKKAKVTIIEFIDFQ